MKHLKLFEGYQSESEVTKICDEYGIGNWSINSDGLVDVDGNVDLESARLTKLPIKFGEVTGFFQIRNNNLTSLYGCPHTVGFYFTCSKNKLKSLVGGPKTVGNDFYCGYNELITLEGGPLSVGGDFLCSNNKLTSLEGLPKIGRGLDISDNYIYSFEGYPKNISGDFSCFDNPIHAIWVLISSSNYKIDYNIIELLNDYDCIRVGREIIIDRFNDFLEEIGKDKVTEVKGYKSI